MPVAPAFCRLVLGDPEAAAAAAAAAAPGVDRVDEVAGAWLACRPELVRRRDALAWGDAASGQPRGVVAGLAALPDLERAAVAAQALGLEPGEVEQALGAEPGAGRGLLARAHAALAHAGPADAACARERERLASAPAARRSTTADHCAKCRAFGSEVDRQRLELRRAAGGEPVRPATPPHGPAEAASPSTEPLDAAPPAPRPAEIAKPAAVSPRRAESAEPAAGAPRRAQPATKLAAVLSRRSGATKGVGALRVRREAAKGLEALRRRAGDAKSRAARRGRGDAPGEGSLPAPARAGGGSRVAPLIAGLRRRIEAARPRTAAAGDTAPRAAGWAGALARRLEPEGRGGRIAVGVAVVLGSGLAGFGVVNTLETPRQSGGDPGVVTATPVGPLPPGVGPTEP